MNHDFADCASTFELISTLKGSCGPIVGFGHVRGRVLAEQEHNVQTPLIWLADNALNRPLDVAVVDTRQTLNHAELFARVQTYAATIERVIGPSNPILCPIYMDTSAESVAALLGVMMAGHVAVPLDPTDGPKSLRILDAMGPRLIVCDDGRPSPYPAARMFGPGDVEAGGVEPRRQAGPLDPARILCSSGSTGAPRGYLDTHGRLVAAASEDDLQPQDRVGLLYSMSFAAATRRVFGALRLGLPLCILRPALHRPSELVGWIKALRITVLPVTPGLFQVIAAALSDNETLQDVRLVVLGSDRVSAADVALARAALPPEGEVEIQFGATEVGLISRLTLASADPVPSSLFGEAPLPLELGIVDQDGETVRDGEVGLLQITTEQPLPLSIDLNSAETELAALDRPVAGSAVLVRTGDLASWDGGCIVHRGRADHYVKVRGYSVDLDDVESALTRLDAVRTGAVVVVDDPTSRLVAHVVMSEDHDPGEIRSALYAELSTYQVPSEVVVWEALPLTSRGKVDRSVLRRHETEIAGPVVGAGMSELELKLLAIWEEILGRSGFGPDDDFFAVGGDSLRAYELVSKIEQELGHVLSPAETLEVPTIAAMAHRITTGPEGRGRSVIPLRPGSDDDVLIVVHGQGGGILFAQGLLAGNVTSGHEAVFGLQLDSVALATTMKSVEGLADHYVAELERLVRLERISIIGWSFGGAVAWEMASRFQKQGVTVKHVVCIDTHVAEGASESAPPIQSGPALWLRREFHRRAFSARKLLADPTLARDRILRRTVARIERPTGTRLIKEMTELVHDAWRPEPADLKVNIIGSEGSGSYHQHVWGALARGGVEVDIVRSSEHLDLMSFRQSATRRALHRALSSTNTN